MKKIKELIKRLCKRNSAEKVLRAYNREKNEAYKRQNYILYWMYDIARQGPFNR
jgi:hypothetical protein